MTTTTSEPTLVSFERDVSLSEVREVTWFAFRRGRLGLIIVLWVIVSIGAAILARPYAGNDPSVTAIVFVVSAVALAVFYGVSIQKASVRLAERAQTAGPENWTVDDGGMHTTSSLGDANLKWAMFLGYKETPRLILLRTARTWLMVPRRCLTADQEHAFVELLDSKLPKV